MRYKNVDGSFFRFVTMHAFDRQTDRQTDRRKDGQKSLRNTTRCTAYSCKVKIRKNIYMTVQKFSMFKYIGVISPIPRCRYASSTVSRLRVNCHFDVALETIILASRRWSLKVNKCIDQTGR